MKKFIAGFLFCFLLMTAILVYADTRQAIEAVLKEVTVVNDGIPSNKELLLYNDSYYISMADISKILDKNYNYDKNSNSAYIASKSDNASDIEPPVLYEQLKLGAITEGKNIWQMQFTNESNYAVTELTVVAKYSDDGKILKLCCPDTIGRDKTGIAVTKIDDESGTGYKSSSYGAGIIEPQEISYKINHWSGTKHSVAYNCITKKYKVVEDKHFTKTS